MQFVFAIMFTAYAHAFPIATAPRPVDPSPLAAGYDFEGIVALSGCSGSLVQFEGQPDTDKAYVLTNGHCYEGGWPAPGTAYHNRSSRVTFTLLRPDGRDAGKIRATKAVYVTMTGTDVALYRVNETYDQIKSRFNIRPLTMSPEHPALHQKLDIISGYWRRGYTCSIDKFVHILREAAWDNADSIRFSSPGCETIGGTSGSPITAHGTRVVIGINNTGNENGARCTESNPCEIDENGNVSYKRGWNYGQQTFWFYSCLTANFEIDLEIPGCQLVH